MNAIDAVRACGIDCTEADLPLVRGLIARQMADTPEGKVALELLDAPRVPDTMPAPAPVRYADIDAVNFSTLKEFALSPLRYKHRIGQPRTDTDAMRLGRIDHRAILEPDTLDALPLWDGDKRTAAALRAFIEAHGEDYVWKESERQAARAMGAAVHAHPIAGPLVRTPGQCEHVITKPRSRARVACKARLDKLCPGLVIEVKTTRNSLSERMIRNQIASFAYHAQMAWYLDMAGVEVGRWIFVEQSAPHDVVVVPASDDWMDAGRKLYNKWLDQLSECRRTGTWPGLAPFEMYVSAPEYVVGGDYGIELDEAITIGGQAA